MMNYTAPLLMNTSRHKENLTLRDYTRPPPPHQQENIYINPICKSKLLY